MNKIILTKEFLIEKYINDGMSINNIREISGNNNYFIYLALKDFKINIRSRVEGLRLAWENKKSPKDILTKEFLEEQYIKNKKSFKEISILVGCDKKTTMRHFKKYNLISRSVSEGTKLNTPRGEENFMYGKLFLGKEGFNYIDGRTPLHSSIRGLEESVNWRNLIFQRDNYTCQECGKKEYVEAHHIKSFSTILSEFLQEYSQFSPLEDKETLVRLALTYKDFWDINNGKTLCIECHEKTKSYKRKTCNQKK